MASQRRPGRYRFVAPTAGEATASPRAASPGPRRRRPARDLLGRRPALSLLAATLVVVGLAVVTWALPARAAPQKLLVNSLNLTKDLSPGDGLCLTADGDCTLRAAIEEANANPDVDTIGVDPGFAGGRINLTNSTSTWMSTATLRTQGTVSGSVSQDSGAVFVVTSPVTIDLGHKITAAPVASLDGPGAALFYINGPDITLKGIDNSYTGETTFYVGPNASNVTITDGTVTTPNYYPERHLLVRGGASNITLSNYSISGYAKSTNADWNWGVVDGTSAALPVQGLTITGNTYHANATGSTTCDSNSAAGCFSNPLYAVGQYVNDLVFSNNRVENLNRLSDFNAHVLNLTSATVNKLTVSGNTIVNPLVRKGEPLIELGDSNNSGGSTIGTFSITGNTFVDVSAVSEEVNGVVRLPGAKSVTSGLVSNNTFLALDAQMAAVYWEGPFSDTMNVTASNVVISDNYFDGWGDNTQRSTVRLWKTGAVTMQRNTFGTHTQTSANTVSEESQASKSYPNTMVNNWSYGSNGKMNTWFPTARSSANVQSAPVQAVACVVPLEVAPPSDPTNTTGLTTARYPAVTPLPVTLDVYWTAGNTAELYLGSYQVSANARTTLQVALPSAPDDPALAGLPAGSALPVNPATGAVSGGLRLQTQDPNAGSTVVSSQYSRVATIGGSCSPAIALHQAETQHDPTMTRDIHFTLTSSLALDPATLTISDLSLAGSTAANAKVVSITPAGDGLTFDVVAKADDSGTIELSLAAGAVATVDGLVNSAPATGPDNQVTYINPLSLTPTSLSLVTGDPTGKSYTIAVNPLAPPPTAPLAFTTTPDPAATEYDLQLTTTSPTITPGELSTTVTVTAPAEQVAADTPAVLSHSVASADPNYDGLVVPSVGVRLFSTNPVLQIDKRVYTGVSGLNDAANIMATGTRVSNDDHLADGTPVWFVFVVTNASHDDWATQLTDLTVTDDVLGTINTKPIDSLPANTTTSLVYERNPVAIGANGPAPGGTP